jgi:hypothetical protein
MGSPCATFAIPKKNENKSCYRFQSHFKKLNLLLKRILSFISYSKDWGHDPFNGRLYLCFSIGLNMGYYHIKLDADAQKLCTIVFPWNTGKYKYKHLPMGINIAWILMFFKM